MKKELFTLLAFIVLGVFGFTAEAQNRSIEFEHAKWKKVISKAKKQNKLIFIDCYTSWCGPCKMLARDVFTQDHVADYMNENFVNFKIDMEKGEGPGLKNQFKVTAFPTLLLVNAKGEVVHRVVGAYSADEFLTYMKEGQSENLSSSALQKAYRSGKRGGEFMFQYLRSLRIANMDDLEAEISKEYMASLKKKDLLLKENWNLLKYFLNDPLTDEFRYIVENRSALATVVGKDEVNGKIYKVYSKKIEQFSYFYPGEGKVFDKEGYNKLIKDLQNTNYDSSSELLVLAQQNEYQRLNDWDKMAYVVDAALDLNILKDYENIYGFFDSAASLVGKTAKSKELLGKALRWAEFASSKETRPEHQSGYLETKAKLLELIGNSDEAKSVKEAAQKADKEAEKAGTKIISVPMMKLGGMKPAKK